MLPVAILFLFAVEWKEDKLSGLIDARPTAQAAGFTAWSI